MQIASGIHQKPRYKSGMEGTPRIPSMTSRISQGYGLGPAKY